MKKYTCHREAIIDLHERGFTSDFQLFGNDLLWIQGKIFIREIEFSIIECHRFDRFPQSNNPIIIFGIVAPIYQARGILLNHYSSYTTKTPIVILKKMKESSVYTTQAENVQSTW
jgi:hypothetical protein